MKLTHTEACELVEELLERMVKTLAYVRLRLEAKHGEGIVPDDGKPHQLDLFAEDVIEEANLLLRVNNYGSYLAGAKRMLITLKDHEMLHLPGVKHNKDDKFVNEAQLKLYMASSRNLEWFLKGVPNDNVRIRTEFIRDKKGKTIGAKATFVKKETTYKEI